jgi:hypothetical protein
MYMAIGAVAIVVVVIVALAAAGILPFSGNSASSPNPQSFAAGSGAAQNATDAAAGGPWTLLIVLGVATHSTYSGSAGNVTGLAGELAGSPCSYTGTNATVPSAPPVDNVTQGAAGMWVYLYTNASGATLVVAVVGSSATVVGTLSGGACDLASSGFTPIPSTGIIDSTTASAAAGSAGGYAFLSANPSANATFLLLGGYSEGIASVGPVWAVEYLACALSGSGPASAPSFLALISATTGGVLLSQTTTVTCPSTSASTPLGTVLALGGPAEAVQGTSHWYNFSVEAAAGGLTWGNLNFGVESPTGTEVSLPAGSTMTVLSLAGASVATFSFATDAWAGGSTGSVTTQDTLDLSTSASLGGLDDVLTVEAVGGFSGTLSVAIP